MYESSMSAFELISLAKDAADIAPDIGNEYYLLWLNSLEGLLYTGVIRECAVGQCPVDGDRADLTGINVTGGQALPRGCDVCAVFSDGRELTRTDGGGLIRYPERGGFSASGSTLYLQCPTGLSSVVQVVYRVRPAPKTVEGMHDQRVAVPDEFLPMVLDYLTGCAYALACEDNQAANRLAKYNAALDDFEAWHKTVGAPSGGEV